MECHGSVDSARSELISLIISVGAHMPCPRCLWRGGIEDATKLMTVIDGVPWEHRECQTELICGHRLLADL